jgi:L-fucose isomerase-like protein
MQELLDTIQQMPKEKPETLNLKLETHIQDALPVANQIYHALQTLAEKHQLQGLTIRCFDLLTAVHNTGCLALARLNTEGVVAGCEGDIPTLLTMMLTKAVTGVSGFQANPAHINPETGEMLFAHCTIPFNMVEHYEFDTHFESGIGVGIRGYMKPGPVTVFKVSGDLSRYFIAEGKLLRCEGKPDLCRTQQVIQLNHPEQARYFLTEPIGNHHVIIPGHVAEVMEEILKVI